MDKGAIGSRRALRLVRLVVAQHFTIMSWPRAVSAFFKMGSWQREM